MSVAEERRLFEALLETRLLPARRMPGTGCCSVADSSELTRQAVQAAWATC